MRVTLLPTLDAQVAACDPSIIDPAGVTLPEGEMPVYVNFDYSKPPIGAASNFAVEDGALLADISLFPRNTNDIRKGRYDRLRFSIGGKVVSIRRAEAGLIADGLTLSVVSLVSHPDPSQRSR
jgi:hypothetical protein